jgi:hypothetical protein
LRNLFEPLPGSNQMHRKPFFRLAAALLAGLAACDSPTANSAVADGHQGQPRLTLPLAALSVTNSGGTPLLSWSPVAGATSYTVRLINYRTVNGAYQRRFFTTFGNQTTTSYLDSAHTYTGVYQCPGDEGPDGNFYGFWLEYQVVALSATDSSSARIYAPIAEC